MIYYIKCGNKYVSDGFEGSVRNYIRVGRGCSLTSYTFNVSSDGTIENIKEKTKGINVNV